MNSAINPNNATTAIKTRQIPNGIHIGESTHHHDQSMFPVNFNMMKTINTTEQMSNPS